MGYELRTVQTVFGPQTIALGRIDEESVNAYTRGQCHAMARALHERTGWTLVETGSDDSWCCPDHWTVKTPDGHYLDITGVSTEDDLTGQWGPLVEATPERWDEVQGCCYLAADLDAARAFVDVVLAEYVPECVAETLPPLFEVVASTSVSA